MRPALARIRHVKQRTPTGHRPYAHLPETRHPARQRPCSLPGHRTPRRRQVRRSGAHPRHRSRPRRESHGLQTASAERAGDPRAGRAGRRPPARPRGAGAGLRRQARQPDESQGDRCDHRLRAGRDPALSFHPELQLVADPELFERYREIAFNAGRLDASMVLDAEDYLRLAAPRMAQIRQQA